MMRMIESTAAQAKKYFSEGLEKADYYIEGQAQERQGQIKGQLAKHLGIEGPVTKGIFYALSDSLHPRTGQPLTPRTNEERLVGWDINFHCPKSVSIVHALSNDDHILNAFQSSVTETMEEDIQRDSKTRVRKGGIYADRNTGSLAWAEFIHETARPTKGHPPDMHLHCHAFVWNATYDEYEGRIKAAKWRDVKRDCPYYQTRFLKRLSDKLVDLGYQIERTTFGFEIVGVPLAVRQFYSKRTNEIGQIAKELNITNSKEKDALGARTRSAKDKGLTMKELKDKWRLQIRLLMEDKDSETPIRFAPSAPKDVQTPGEAIDNALGYCFERSSVTDERKILRAAYRHAIGHRENTIEKITQAAAVDKRLIRIAKGGRVYCTTKEVLKEEQYMVELAKEGKGRLTPLYENVPGLDLEGQQAAAVAHVLTTPNRTSIIMGRAGAGKTTLLQELTAKINMADKQVFSVAPTSEAVRVLKEEGFEQSDTVAKLLLDKQMQQKLKNQVLIVDEAGLLGTRDMTELLILARDQDAQLVLCGDTRQNSAILRGDALRVLNIFGKIEAAEVTKIHRQKNEQYRAAVADLSEGNVKDAFAKLDGIGAIKQVDRLNPNVALVDDYVTAVKKGKSALVVSPTHKQNAEVTAAIREKLREDGKIGKKEVSVRKLDNLNLTLAEKEDARNYKEGQIVQFNQNVKGIKRGSAWTVSGVNGKNVLMKNKEGKTASLPRGKESHFDVYHESEIGLSKGDILRITRNGFDEDDKRINNGMALEVYSISKDGWVVLRNPKSKVQYILGRDYGHISHAHVITSYAAQGKTVDEVFISQPSSTFDATDMKNFYVSVSRGRLFVNIYTDDKAALLEHASEKGDRQSALELVSPKSRHEKYIEQRQRNDYEKMPEMEKSDKDHWIEPHITDRDYEPGLSIEI